MNSEATEKDGGISNLLLQHHHYLQAQKYEGWRAQAATLSTLNAIGATASIALAVASAKIIFFICSYLFLIATLTTWFSIAQINELIKERTKLIEILLLQPEKYNEDDITVYLLQPIVKSKQGNLNSPLALSSALLTAAGTQGLICLVAYYYFY